MAVLVQQNYKIYNLTEKIHLSTAESSQALKVYGGSPLYGEASVEKAAN